VSPEHERLIGPMLLAEVVRRHDVDEIGIQSWRDVREQASRASR